MEELRTKPLDCSANIATLVPIVGPSGNIGHGHLPAMPLPCRTAAGGPCCRREMGDRATLPGGRWPYRGLFQAPQRAPPQPNCSLPIPSGQPCSPPPETPPPVKAATQASRMEVYGGWLATLGTGLDDPGTPPPTKAAPPLSRMEWYGGWLAMLGTGLNDPGTPPPTKAAAPASGLQAGWPHLAQLESGGVGLQACGALGNQCTTG